VELGAEISKLGAAQHEPNSLARSTSLTASRLYKARSKPSILCRRSPFVNIEIHRDPHFPVRRSLPDKQSSSNTPPLGRGAEVTTMGFTTGFVRLSISQFKSTHYTSPRSHLSLSPHLNQHLLPQLTRPPEQLGGVTLTYSLLYLSLYLHRKNRTYQHTLLSQQSLLLNSLTNPRTTSSTSASEYQINPDTYEAEAERKEPLSEVLKERWNAEVEGMVRRVQETNWREVRERWERRGVGLWRNITKD